MAKGGHPEPALRRIAPTRRRFGQNFLVDAGIAKRLVRSILPIGDEAVLEIGPGRGALTEHLIGQAPRIAAVEIDRDLAASLRARFDPARLVVLEGSVLRLSFSGIPEAIGLPAATPLVVVSSLPYNISKPVARKLVAERARVPRALLIFQREVAARLTASPGSKEYGPLAILVGLAYEVEAIETIPPGAFRPRPKVFSTATLWKRRAHAGIEESLFPRLESALAASFGRRRQTILRNLRESLRDEERARALLRSAEIDGSVRAESVDRERFVALARAWPEIPAN